MLTFLIGNVDLCAANVNKSKAFTVVVDAGHGGKDSGAVDNNVKEKDINLGVALELQELLKKDKNFSAVLTRDDDTFLSLQQRADKANSANADLFISIHTNSLDKSNPNRTTIAGSSVYVLGQQKEQNNMNVARRENSVIKLERNQEVYEGFDPSQDESYIIFEMAQKKNLAQSFKFAEIVQNQLVKTAQRGNRGVHQAGFWVLWATSMPSVLIELDFITNPNSAKYIASEQGQKQLAKAIYNALLNYRNAQHQEAAVLNSSTANSNSSEEVAVLPVANSDKKENKITTQQNNSHHAINHNNVRKRRSDYARELSVSRVIESDEIRILSESQNIAQVDNSPYYQHDEEPQENLNLDKKKGKKGSKKKNNKINNKKNNNSVASSDNHTAIQSSETSQSASQASKPRHRSSLQRMETVYQVRLLQSDKELSATNPVFHGFNPDSSYLENNKYNYTIGEAKEPGQIMELLREVQVVLPEAVIVKRTRNIVVK